MASAEGQLAFKGTSTASEKYIDLSSAMTAVNRVQYHQFKGNVPLAYHCTIRCVAGSKRGSLQVLTAPNTWTVRNALVKTSAGWREQLKSAGLKLSDLSTYGRRMRVGLHEAMVDLSNGALDNVLNPQVIDVEGSWQKVFPSYTVGGTTITYEKANEVTRIALPANSEELNPEEMNVVVLGHNTTFAADKAFVAVQNYIKSRGGVTDEPDSAEQGPDPSSWLQRLFSSQAPSTDEIIEEADDYMNFRPYTDSADTASTPLNNDLTYNGRLASPFALDTQGGGDTQTAVHTLDFIAPCGLVELYGIAENDEVIITVNAITEM